LAKFRAPFRVRRTLVPRNLKPGGELRFDRWASNLQVQSVDFVKRLGRNDALSASAEPCHGPAHRCPACLAWPGFGENALKVCMVATVNPYSEFNQRGKVAKSIWGYERPKADQTVGPTPSPSGFADTSVVERDDGLALPG